MSVNGLVVMTPTSIVSTGAGNSSSIGADGKVTFSSCDSLSLNGVFTSSYDNYMIVVRSKEATNTQAQLAFRLRVAGTDDATANSYVSQRLTADGTTPSGSRSTADYGWFMPSSSTIESGGVCYIYGPSLAQPTAYRVVSAQGTLNAYINDYAVTHNQATSYSGFTMLRSGFSYTGCVTVFGFNQ